MMGPGLNNPQQMKPHWLRRQLIGKAYILMVTQDKARMSGSFRDSDSVSMEHIVDIQPVEATLYSLSDAPPAPTTEREQRASERHLSLYRVGSILLEDRRELCLIKNISAGGMMIHLYCSIADDTPVTVELKSGQPVSGRVNWTRDQNAGIIFDQLVDVIDILSTSMDGPRPRMPRIEIGCHTMLRHEARTLRVQACDISQGGMRVRAETVLPQGSDVIISLPGFEPQPGIVCWTDNGSTGISFNRLLPLSELVAWLHEQRDRSRSAN